MTSQLQRYAAWDFRNVGTSSPKFVLSISLYYVPQPTIPLLMFMIKIPDITVFALRYLQDIPNS